MLKSVILCVFLWHGMCEGLRHIHTDYTETDMLSLPARDSRKNSDTDVQTERKVNYYFNITMIYNINAPLFGTTASPTPLPTALTEESPTASPTAPTTTATTASTKSTRVHPGKGYIVTNGVGAHKVHTDRRTWTDARQTCIDEGGDLAVIQSHGEELLVQKIMSLSSIHQAWIGYHNQLGKEGWVSVFNESLSKDRLHFWTDPMDSSPEKQCGMYGLISTRSGIFSYVCDVSEWFVCKITNI